MNIRYVEAFLGQVLINWTGIACVKNLKHYCRWRRSLFPGATPVSDEQPWITFDAIECLEERVKSSHNVFEFGGGGSTLFFLKRCQVVITVEHDEKWFLVLKNRIDDKEVKNWVGRLVEPEPGSVTTYPSASNPDHYSSADAEDVNFRKYASSIDSYPDEYFDVVLVDGRSRPACIKHALPKLKSGGLIVLDNADRSYYIGPEIEKMLKEYPVLLCKKGPSPYVESFTQTNIWEKI